ncbi:hypothetical protein ABZX51_007197 [Aspergillus tubingensis]
MFLWLEFDSIWNDVTDRGAAQVVYTAYRNGHWRLEEPSVQNRRLRPGSNSPTPDFAESTAAV